MKPFYEIKNGTVVRSDHTPLSETERLEVARRGLQRIGNVMPPVFEIAPEPFTVEPSAIKDWFAGFTRRPLPPRTFWLLIGLIGLLAFLAPTFIDAGRK